MKQYLFSIIGIFVITALCKAQTITFYGMTDNGGANQSGNIFKCTSTGTDTDLVDFPGVPGAHYPQGNLILAVDSNFYGTTLSGGANSYGNIFFYNPSTGIYTDMLDFTGDTGAYVGQFPYCTLLQATDTNLYGTTSTGGTHGYGNLFVYNFSLDTLLDLVDFTGDAGAYSGNMPYGKLVQVDSNLYGVTHTGGVNALGNIFKYNYISNAYTDAVDFTGTTGLYIGSEPLGSLILAKDSNLYGMTWLGGTNGKGNIFKYNPYTGIFADLVDFTGTTGSYIGAKPYGSLMQALDGNLYGMTSEYLTSGYGNIFKYNPTSGIYTDLLDFTGNTGAYIGLAPEGSLIQASDSNLYGMTTQGGANTPAYGNVFKYNPVSGTFTDLVDFTDMAGLYPGNDPTGDLIEYSNNATSTGIKTVINEPAIHIYPNVNDGHFTITGLQYGQTIAVYNSLGQLIQRTKVDDSTMPYNISEEANGIYLLQILTSDGMVMNNEKVIKVK